MAKNQLPYFYKTSVYERQTFAFGDGISPKIIATGQADDSSVFLINITSTDNLIAHDFIIQLSSSGTDTPIKYGTIAANQGTTSISPDPLVLVQSNAGFIASRTLDVNQNYLIELPSGWTLKMNMLVAVTSGKIVNVTVLRKDY